MSDNLSYQICFPSLMTETHFVTLVKTLTSLHFNKTFRYPLMCRSQKFLNRLPNRRKLCLLERSLWVNKTKNGFLNHSHSLWGRENTEGRIRETDQGVGGRGRRRGEGWGEGGGGGGGFHPTTLVLTLRPPNSRPFFTGLVLSETFTVTSRPWVSDVPSLYWSRRTTPPLIKKHINKWIGQCIVVQT